MKGKIALRIFVALIVIIFFGHQFYASVYKPISTESAVYYEATDGLNVTGIIMRHETVVNGTVDGTYHYHIADGTRVAKKGVIASVYKDASASGTLLEIESLDAQIAEMTELQNYHNQQATDLDLINQRVDESLNELVRTCGNGNYEKAQDNADRLLGHLNRRQIITGQAVDFSARIAELKKQRDALQASLPAEKGQIVSPVSGYFSASADGYETILTGENLSDYTVEFLDGMQPKNVEQKAVGKIVSDYDWYILVKMPMSDSMRYKVGQTVELQTEIESRQSLSATVAQINVSDSQESAVIIFSCSEMSRELASMRSGPMKIVTKVYKGLRISKSALRMVNGKRGVYTVSGITLNFVPVQIIYSDGGYVICEQKQTNESVLRLYDEVVVKGKNLYDGKIVG